MGKDRDTTSAHQFAQDRQARLLHYDATLPVINCHSTNNVSVNARFYGEAQKGFLVHLLLTFSLMY